MSFVVVQANFIFSVCKATPSHTSSIILVLLVKPQAAESFPQPVTDLSARAMAPLHIVLKIHITHCWLAGTSQIGTRAASAALTGSHRSTGLGLHLKGIATLGYEPAMGICFVVVFDSLFNGE